MVGKGLKRLTYGSSRRTDGIQALWLSCQSDDDESEKRRTNPKRHQTLKLRYHIEAHVFDLVTDHTTRSSQPAPPPPAEIPIVIPDSPDPIQLLHEEDLYDQMDLKDPAEAPRNLKEDSCDEPFRFVALPVEIRKQILKMAVSKPRKVTPFYYTGSVELAAHLVTKPNIDISLLLVNKQLHAEAADALYGINVFRFTRPEIALWWLRHIGPSNVNRIRHAHFFLDSFEHMNFHVREERLWHHVFACLEPNQNLDEILVSFERWNNDDLNWKVGLELSLIQSAREGALFTLLRFRGLQLVEIRGGQYLNLADIKLLSDNMLLPKDPESVPLDE